MMLARYNAALTLNGRNHKFRARAVRKMGGRIILAESRPFTYDESRNVVELLELSAEGATVGEAIERWIEKAITLMQASEPCTEGVKGRAVVTKVRPADKDHAVLTVEGGRGHYRRQPCAGCPWRKDQVGAFPAEAFRLSAHTAYDMAQQTFACHESGSMKPAVCAGFLLRGAAHNLSVRLRAAQGTDYRDVSDGGHDLFDDYRSMAEANGVDADDPVLALCR